jgi:hypothetical protein
MSLESQPRRGAILIHLAIGTGNVNGLSGKNGNVIIAILDGQYLASVPAIGYLRPLEERNLVGWICKVISTSPLPSWL